MKTINYLIILSFITFLLSCSGNATKTNDKDAEGAESKAGVSSSDVKNKGKYQIKSGKIAYSSKVMGMDQTTVISFDDFGNKEVTDTYTEAMGIKLHSRTIVKDGYSYNLNMDEKTGTKVKMYGAGSSIDYSNLTKEIEEKMNLKKLGTETLLGKVCDVYTFDFKEMSTKGKTWIWKGLALKSAVNSMGMDVTLTGTSLEENPKIDPAIFEVPAGFKLIER